MKTISSRAIATAFASMLLMGSAFAQTPAAPAAKAERAPVVQRGLAGMLQGSRRQGVARQGTQEIPFRMQAGRRREEMISFG